MLQNFMFRDNWASSFPVIVLTNRQTNEPDQKHDLLIGGNDMSVFVIT